MSERFGRSLFYNWSRLGSLKLNDPNLAKNPRTDKARGLENISTGVNPELFYLDDVFHRHSGHGRLISRQEAEAVDFNRGWVNTI